MKHILLAILALIASPACAQVAITQLPAATTPLNGTEVFPIVQGGQTRKATVGSIPPAFPSQNASAVLAAPSGSSGVPTFRPLVAADFPIAGASTNQRLTDVTAAIYAGGADPTGVADSTPAVQAAVNSGGTAIFFPPGTYKVCGVLVPNTAALHIFGAGTPSKITQTACGQPVFRWSTAAMAYPEQTISNLYFDATAGNAHTIDTSGAGGITLRSLYFNNTPASRDNIYLNGAAATAMHDARVFDVQFYDQAGGPTGNAMIEFGPLSADSLVSNAIGNGAFLTAYGLKIGASATTITVTSSHLYNVTQNALAALSCNNCQFVGNTWDHSLQDTAVLTVTNSTFVGEQYEAVQAGKNAVTLTNASDNTFIGSVWGGVAAGYIVNETGTSDFNAFVGGQLNGSSNWAASITNLIGAHSFVEKVPGYETYGARHQLVGTTAAAQAQNTTVFLGVNAAQAVATNTAYLVPYDSRAINAVIAVDVTPAAGQTFTFTVFDGATNMGNCVISNTQFQCTITFSGTTTVGANDQVWIRSVFSATSGAANVRYAVKFAG